MSNIYIQEPPTEGKVLLQTSLGDFEIELWSKECPKACRNFVQHCMDGYYNGSIFHRVVKGFIAQGGDPTGTGEGGESIYGAPFKDEFHSRLRFVRRGLVAMANGGKNDNTSQFFFTLGQTPDLQNKHTIFGKVAGDTLYNLPKFENLETDRDDRPVYPPKIVKTEVLSNPFPDIAPRVSAQKPESIEHEIKQPRSGATKNFGLLSFGDEAEEDELETEKTVKVLSKKIKSKSSHDLAKDPKLSAVPAVVNKKSRDMDEDADLEADRVSRRNIEEDEKSRIRDKLKKSVPESVKQEEALESDEDKERQRSKHVESLRKEFKELKKSLRDDKKKAQNVPETSGETSRQAEDTDNDILKAFHETQNQYKAKAGSLPRPKAANREEMTLAYLAKFKNLIAGAREGAENGEMASKPPPRKDDGELTDEELEDDPSDMSWLTHELRCENTNPVLAKDASTKDDDWFDIYDPRNPINKRKREKKADTRETGRKEEKRSRGS